MTTQTRFALQPMSGHIGVEVSDIDVTKLSNDDVAHIRRLWLEHLVIVFKEQDHIDTDDLACFAARFGPLYRHPFIDRDMAVHPLNVAAGGYWHSDVTFSVEPPAGTMLHAQALPPAGGDTIWANMYLAYETLAPPLQAFLDALRAIHDFDHFFRNPMGDTLETDQFVLDKKRSLPLPSHPVVRTHPETGRKALFVNESFTRRIDGLSRMESDAILDLLFRHSVKLEHTCRHRWSVGDICFWDNRCTMHYPLDDWGGSIRDSTTSPRRMQRVTIHAQPVT